MSSPRVLPRGALIGPMTLCFRVNAMISTRPRRESASQLLPRPPTSPPKEHRRSGHGPSRETRASLVSTAPIVACQDQTRTSFMRIRQGQYHQSSLTIPRRNEVWRSCRFHQMAACRRGIGLIRNASISEMNDGFQNRVRLYCRLYDESSDANRASPGRL